MNLPTGYANLSVLSTFLQESRHTTIRRAKDGVYKTARQFSKAKLSVWIIRQDELFEIMAKHREDVPAYVGCLNLRFLSDFMGPEKEEAETRLFKIVEEIEQKYGGLLDQDATNYWVEEEAS